MLGRFLFSQLQEYIYILPLNENNEPMQAVKVDYNIEDPRRRIDFDEFIDKKKKKYGIL